LLESLDVYFRDNVKGKRLTADGQYERVSGRRESLRSQEELYRRAALAVHEAELSQRTVFEPHKAPAAGR
jgi:hypothetical protein